MSASDLTLPQKELRGSLLYFDCFSGISGDMTLGALLDLGVPEAVVRDALALLPIEGYRLERTRVQRGALFGTKIHVHLDEPSQSSDHHHSHSHDHSHDHGHGRDPHPHRHYREIKQILMGALSGEVLRRTLGMFDRIAKIEAHLHGVSVEEVAFHEVGAVDSIVDIVGTAAALAWLAPSRVVSRRVPLGGGSVQTAHGLLPVPAPATAELLLGCEVEAGGTAELTTPTGAAIIAASVESFGSLPPVELIGVGWGAGERELPDRPNLLRVIAGTPASAPTRSESLLVLECNVDDMNPEWTEPLFEALFSAGALDVWLQPIVMKKGRPALLISALTTLEGRAQVEGALFRESTTIGVRTRTVDRTALERRFADVETPYGLVRMKLAGPAGEVYNAAPEYEVCRRLARERGVPVKVVYLAALAAFHRDPERR